MCFKIQLLEVTEKTPIQIKVVWETFDSSYWSRPCSKCHLNPLVSSLRGRQVQKSYGYPDSMLSVILITMYINLIFKLMDTPVLLIRNNRSLILDCTCSN